jgi:hypothetical protein
MIVRLLWYIFLLVSIICQPTKQKRRKHSQDSNNLPVDVNEDSQITSNSIDIEGNSIKVKQEVQNIIHDNNVRRASCVLREKLNENFVHLTQREVLRLYIISSYRYYWGNSLHDSKQCLMEALQLSKALKASHERAMMNALAANLKLTSADMSERGYDDIKIDHPDYRSPHLYYYEFLGPFPVGKLEIDGDPSFAVGLSADEDPILSLLQADIDRMYYSELTFNAELRWSPIQVDGSQVC